jgi:excisionase family DNA binding protein
MQPSSFDRQPTTDDQRPTTNAGVWALESDSSVAAQGARVSGPSPSAWDDPVDDEAEEAGESAALQEWYRYIDSLARPSRRGELEDEEPDATPLSWGVPWTPPEPAGLDEGVAEEIVAQLAPEAAPEEPVEWQPSVSEMPVPDLQEFIPVQQVAAPAPPPVDVAQWTAPPRPEPLRAESLTARATPAPTTGEPPDASRQTPGSASDARALVPVSPVRTTEVVLRPGQERPASVAERATPFPERQAPAAQRPAPHAARPAPATEPPGGSTPDRLPSIAEIRQQLPRTMERMLRVPTTEIAQHSYKSPFKETREELIERLLDPCLTLEEAARLLGVCPTTVRRYTNRGLLRHQRTVGNQRRFRLSHVLEFLDEHGGSWRLEDEKGAAGETERRAGDRSTVH